MPSSIFIKASVCMVLIMGLAWLAPHPILGGIIGVMGGRVIIRAVDEELGLK